MLQPQASERPRRGFLSFQELPVVELVLYVLFGVTFALGYLIGSRAKVAQ